LMNEIFKNGWEDKEYLKDHTENPDEIRKWVEDYPVEKASEICGVPVETMKQVAKILGEAKTTSICYTLGITEHICGTDNVKTLANLSMLTGHIGRPSTGVNPLRGQNNVQGACDMGAIHSVLPGYQKVTDEVARAKFEKAWGVKLPTNKGGRVTDYIEKAGEGILRGFYVFGEDPALSEPNQDKVIENLRKLEFLAVQEIFMSETAKLAT
jgi:formate dehydrogenase alpha subunit